MRFGDSCLLNTEMFFVCICVADTADESTTAVQKTPIQLLEIKKKVRSE